MRFHDRLPVAFLLAALLAACAPPSHRVADDAGHAAAPSDDPTMPGAHAVGVRVVRASDTARRGVGRDSAAPRPMLVLQWYPAERDPARRAWSIGDYAELVAVEGSSDSLTAERRAAGREEMVQYLRSLGATEAGARASLDVRLHAAGDARLARGRFPVVLLAVGKDESPVLHAMLGEHLASHGFVVVTTPAVGTVQRAMRWEPVEVETHAADLRGALRTLARVSSADASRVGVVGFSFGSATAVLLAGTVPGARAVVSLDGSIAFRDRVPVFRRVPGLAMPLRVPMLLLRASDPRREDLSLVHAIAPRGTLGTFRGSGHLDFQTLGALATLPGFERFQRLGEATSPPGLVHRATLHLTRGFLEEHVAGRDGAWRAAMTTLSGVAPGIDSLFSSGSVDRAWRGGPVGRALAPGMRLTYGASETDTQPSWVIDSVALGIDVEGRQGCSRIRLRTRPDQPAPEMRLVCASGDTLLAWRAADRTWRPQRPLAPRMTFVLPQADGGTVEVTSSDTVRVSVSGRDFTALGTTFLTRNASGAPVRRLTERYVAALHTASEGMFEVPDSATTGAWRVAQRFRLVRVAGP